MRRVDPKIQDYLVSQKLPIIKSIREACRDTLAALIIRFPGAYATAHYLASVLN